jgi:hypothetical protein
MAEAFSNFSYYIKELHDKYKPEAIFMTQTSATLAGWAIKEAWKKAWPEEKVPKIFTINTRGVCEDSNQFSKDNPNYEQIMELEKKLRKGVEQERSERIESLKKEINKPVYGEFGLKQQNKDKTELENLEKSHKEHLNKDYQILSDVFNVQFANEYAPEFKKLKYGVADKLKKFRIKGNIAIVDENAGYRKALSNGFLPLNWREESENVYEPQPGTIYDRNSLSLGIAKQVLDSAKKDLGLNSKTVVLGLDPSGDSAGRLWGGPWERHDSTENKDISKYYRVKSKSDKEFAKKRIEEFKKIGRENGELIRLEIDRKNNLENRLGSTTAIIGLTLATFFLSSNITGNAVANLNQPSLNFIGTGLFLVGLVGAFMYFRKKR